MELGLLESFKVVVCLDVQNDELYIGNGDKK